MDKKRVLEKCQEILYGNMLGKPLKDEDFNFLSQIFPLHKKYKEKCDGKRVKSIVIRKNPKYHNNNFALVLCDNDGSNVSIVDISYIESVNRPGLKKDIEAACKSIVNVDDKILKPLIKEWLDTFDNGELTVGVYLDGGTFTDQNIINNFSDFYNARRV